jgi:basic membrane lipoprotein Med (substrate-binding protein (PBP1-ABC) superfamily)
MSDKSTILKTFNSHFFEFIQDIINLFPENTDLKSTKTAMELIKKANPTVIIKAWNTYVYEKYKDVINNGDISFFFDKDYKNDLTNLSNSGDIMKAIDKMREPVKDVSEENKAHSLKYIQNLCKLSNLYSSM